MSKDEVSVATFYELRGDMSYLEFMDAIKGMSEMQLRIALTSLFMEASTIPAALAVAKSFSPQLPAEFTPNTGTN